MKVGIDARGAIWYRGTGIGTYTYQLLYHLMERKDAQNYRPFWPGEEFACFDISDDLELEKMESANEYWEEWFLPHALEKENIDIYHVPQNGIGLPKIKKCRQVVTIHDLIPYIYPETVGKGYLKTFLTEMPRVIQETDQIITVSQWSKRDICKIFDYPGERIEVVLEAPEPIYQKLPKDRCRDFLAEKYQIQDDYIMYVGGFSPRKNVKALIRAFAKIKDELTKKTYLVLPGRRQKEQDFLDTLIGALNLDEHVIFPGFVPVSHLPYFYNGAAVFIYPSYYEGFGLPPLEAMACGTPVCVANASSLPEIAAGGALLFDPYEPLELAQGLFKLLTNEEDRKKLGKKGFAHVKKFSWKKTVAETVAIYKKMMTL